MGGSAFFVVFVIIGFIIRGTQRELMNAMQFFHKQKSFAFQKQSFQR
jgi:hypothetical protein